MTFSTTLTVPTLHLRELMARFAAAGFTTLDTGERIATEEGLDAEARVVLLHVPMDDALPLAGVLQ